MRLHSSQQALNALLRLGCELHGKARGSHQGVIRRSMLADGTERIHVSTLVLGKKELDRFTLRAVLRQLGIAEADFEAAVR